MESLSSWVQSDLNDSHDSTKGASLIYSVRHTTTFRYEPAVRESVMEVRMQPRSEAPQRCLSFRLDVNPAANITQYRDFSGQHGASFRHCRIAHRGQSHGALHGGSAAVPPAPRKSEAGDWADLDALTAADDYWEMLLPSEFARSSAALEQLAAELRVRTARQSPRVADGTESKASTGMFAYVPNSTKVDSPIDEALRTRQGVCQDFAHIMIALVRPLRIPCRYVSGYLFHRDADGREGSLPGRSVARLGGGPGAAPGLGCIRPDQQPGRRRPPYSRGYWSRLRRRSAHPWCI